MSQQDPGTDGAPEGPSEEPTGVGEPADAGAAPDEVAPAVRRARTTDGSGGGRRGLWIAGIGAAVALIAIAVVLLLVGGDEEEEPVASRRTTTTTESTTTSVAPAPAPMTAPLTGVVISAEEAGRLARPAVAVKIDNAPRAMPQIGLGMADVVLELRVEGISRFIAVFHSKDVGSAGPVRSARTSDPDILGAFGRPLVAWSGGNDNVVRAMREADWIQNLNHDGLASAYRRERGRPAPHNLVVDVPQLWANAQDPVVPPTPIFEYRDPAAPPAGRPAAGFTIPVGDPATFVWDAGRGGWLRWANGRRHTDDSGEQLAPANVVVLGTRYVPSSADRRSPEAQSIGGGQAWVLTGGNLVTGAWFRQGRNTPWVLVDEAGAPIQLAPGQTFVLMPEEGTGPSELDPGAAQALLTGP